MKTQLTKTCISILAVFVVTIAVGVSVFAQGNLQMIVDRGLPTANLNGPTVELRSNVSLGTPAKFAFWGDDFTVPQPAASGAWRINTIRLWFVGGPADNDADLTNDSFLGDQSLGYLTLWVGTNNNLLSPVAQAGFIPGSNATNNRYVVATRVQYSSDDPNARDYYNLPTLCNAYGCHTPPLGYSTIVQLDFKNLNLTYPAGTLVRFGLYANGAGQPFTHASNAARSGSRQDQSDGLISTFKFQTGGAYFDFAWMGGSADHHADVIFDKPMDMNIQVLGTLVKKGK